MGSFLALSYVFMAFMSKRSSCFFFHMRAVSSNSSDLCTLLGHGQWSEEDCLEEFPDNPDPVVVVDVVRDLDLWHNLGQSALADITEVLVGHPQSRPPPVLGSLDH